MSQSAGEGPGQRDEVVPMAMLLVKSGFYEGLEVALEARTVIGRGRRADLVLAEPTISREHAAFAWDSVEGWYVEDLGSTNGSYANGTRIQTHQLKQGDEIVMGRLVVEVTLPGAP